MVTVFRFGTSLSGYIYRAEGGSTIQRHLGSHSDPYLFDICANRTQHSKSHDHTKRKSKPWTWLQPLLPQKAIFHDGSPRKISVERVELNDCESSHIALIQCSYIPLNSLSFFSFLPLSKIISQSFIRSRLSPINHFLQTTTQTK